MLVVVIFICMMIWDVWKRNCGVLLILVIFMLRLRLVWLGWIRIGVVLIGCCGFLVMFCGWWLM